MYAYHHFLLSIIFAFDSESIKLFHFFFSFSSSHMLHQHWAKGDPILRRSDCVWRLVDFLIAVISRLAEQLDVVVFINWVFIGFCQLLEVFEGLSDLVDVFSDMFVSAFLPGLNSILELVSTALFPLVRQHAWFLPVGNKYRQLVARLFDWCMGKVRVNTFGG